MRSQPHLNTKGNLLVVEDTDNTIADINSKSSLHGQSSYILPEFVDLEMQSYVNNNMVNIKTLPRHQDSMDLKMKEIEDEVKGHSPDFYRKRSTQAKKW